MPWLKMDDNFITNAKLLGVGIEAKLLYIWALGFSAKELTDGFLRRSQVKAVAGLAGIADCEAAAAELVEARLWEAEGEDYRIHDYLEYNPCREEALALRQVRAEAGSIGGRRSVESRRQAKEAKAQANASARAQAKRQQNSTPDPVPVPDPVPEKKTKGAAAAAAGGAKAPSDGLHQERFAVLARNCGHDLANLGKREGGMIGTAAASLRNFTPDQIQTMCDNYPTHYPRLAMTPNAIATNASKLLKPGPYALSPPSRPPNGRSASHVGGATKEVSLDDGAAEYIRRLDGNA